MPTKHHIHTIIRAHDDRFMCADSDCSWRDSKSYLTNKQSICPYCTVIFALTKTNLRLARPWCGFCDKKPLSVQDAFKRKAEELMLKTIDGMED